MLSNTTRLERAERAAQAERERQAAQIKAQCAAMSNEELATITATYLSDYEAEHGPLAPRDFAPLFDGLDSAAVDALLDTLSTADLLAWRKHDEQNGTGCARACPPPPVPDTGPPPVPWHCTPQNGRLSP